MTTAETDVAGYRLQKRVELKWLPGTLFEFVHEPTGARHIHIQHPDDNLACNIAVRTQAQNATGVAHILEHAVLNGSRDFDVRSVFFEMTKRSLATFMNAMTRSDSTQYPFSTRSRTDFKNLLRVYLDAVFFPALTKDTFLQEGWHHELIDGKLSYKGVVFNEMKATNDGDFAMVWIGLGAALFPGSIYSYNFGGDSSVMPQLTWQGLRDFHKRHYHPANATFITAGNIEPDEILQAINDLCLKDFDRGEAVAPVADSLAFDKPRRFDIAKPAPAVGADKAGQAIVAWASPRLAGDPVTSTDLSLLTGVLIGHDGAPLRKALLDSKLGTGLSTMAGYNDSYRHAIFSAGLQGCAPADAEKIQDLVLNTLRDIVKNGVDRADVDGALDRFEFGLRERDGNYSLLLTLIMPVRAALDSLDIEAALDLETNLKQLRERALEPGFIEGLIQKELLDNPHRCLMVLTPDAELAEKRRKDEEQRLAKEQAAMSDDDLKAVAEVAKRLEVRQSQKTDVSGLPDLELSEVPLKFDEPAAERRGAVTVYKLPTSGVTYLTVAADFAGLPIRLKRLLPVLARAIPRLPAAGRTAAENTARIARETGGIWAMASPVNKATDGGHIESFMIGGKALDRRQASLAELVFDAAAADLDPDVVRKVISEMHQQFESSLAQGGGLSSSLAMARLDEAGALRDLLGGHGLLSTLREIDDDARLPEVIKELKEIRDLLFTSANVEVLITATEKDADPMANLVESRLAKLPSGKSNGQSDSIALLSGRSEARTVNSTIASNVAAYKTVPYSHPDAPALMVLATYMSQTVVLNEVREKGGAYGAGSGAAPGQRALVFLSGSDPNVERTYDAYRKAIAHVLDDPIEAQDLKQSILSSCRAVDPLESPEDRARRAWTDSRIGRTLDMRRAFKQALLAVTGEDIRRVAREYLKGEPVRVSVGSTALMEKAKAARPELFESVAPA